MNNIYLVCMYGGGDDYNPCNGGKMIKILPEEEHKVLREYNYMFETDRYMCPFCGDNAIRVDYNARKRWNIDHWKDAPDYWRWV